MEKSEKKSWNEKLEQKMERQLEWENEKKVYSESCDKVEWKSKSQTFGETIMKKHSENKLKKWNK